MRKRISLKEAVKFHGHLGPYLVLGILAGELALKRLKLKKYFGLEVMVWGASNRPKSCLIDGLQLSTGATYGKGNIYKHNASAVRINFKSKDAGRVLSIRFNKALVRDLDCLKTHADSEKFARRLYAGRLKGFLSHILTTTY